MQQDVIAAGHHARERNRRTGLALNELSPIRVIMSFEFEILERCLLYTSDAADE